LRSCSACSRSARTLLQRPQRSSPRAESPFFTGDYVVALDLTRLETQAREHLAILARIEAGDRPGAAELLVQHLEAGRAARARLLAGAAISLARLGGGSQLER
jgi:DNA-binding GntR family transcriptional regulator